MIKDTLKPWFLFSFNCATSVMVLYFLLAAALIDYGYR
eukprot:UN16999